MEKLEYKRSFRIGQITSKSKVDRMASVSTQSSIREFYENKSVFITGVTGFLGKGILIKLLKSCPNVARVYVLIRDKKDTSATARLSDILRTEVMSAKQLALLGSCTLSRIFLYKHSFIFRFTAL